MILRVDNFASWRAQARQQLTRNTPPDALIWQGGDDDQQFLFSSEAATEPAAAPINGSVTLPRAFLEAAKSVALHRDPNRWALLYRIAWRIQNENRNLLHVETDDDIRAIVLMQKSIGRDIHKMRAFVRFRRVEHDGIEQFVAWYDPEHHILEANQKFFVDRFGSMRWAILTPEASMVWDLENIHYGPGVPRSQAPAEDEMEDLWRTYYASIYNPARLNLDAMRAELPVHRWVDLPESRIIPELVRISRGRVESMVGFEPPAASAFIPPNAELPVLREAVRRCNACELCALATQPVFGEGAPHSRIMLVGEQPGDEEDRAGRPFVGPAGQVLAGAMRDTGLERDAVYLTNAVKAFRFEERGKRRIHQTPKALHIATCRPWLEAEITAVRPQRIVCLGATAAQSVLGRSVRINAERGHPIQHSSGAEVLVTYHPSAILRAYDENTASALGRALIEDLAAAQKPS